MSQDLSASDFEAALGPAPSPKSNLPELDVGPLTAADLAQVTVNPTAQAIPVVAHEPGSMPAPYLYVPALNEPAHPMKIATKDGHWMEMARSVDLRHFGRVVDNRGADIGPALRNFHDFIREKNGGTVILPPGTFALESPVEMTLNIGAGNIGVGIIGAGTEMSRIVVDAQSVSHGPRYHSPNPAAFFQFERFAILADGEVAGRPLEATMPTAGGNRRNCSHIVRDMLVQGWDAHISASKPHDHHFQNGFNFTGAWRLIYENNHVAGPITDGVKSVHRDWSDTSRLWWMEDGLLIDGCYAPTIRDCQFYFIANPILCRGQAGGVVDPDDRQEAERAMFTNARFPTCKTAITWFRTGAEPELVITDCFFDYRDRGVDIKGSRLGQVFRNAFFQKTDTVASRLVPIDIRLDHCLDFLVDRNIHHEHGDTRRIAVAMVNEFDPSNTTRGVEIRRNRLSSGGQIATYFYKGPNTGSVIYEPGALDGTITAEVLDQEASEKTSLDLRVPYSMSLSLGASGQSLASGVWTKLAWGEALRMEDRLAGAWSLSAADELLVPDELGLGQMQLRINLQFAENATGRRQCRLLRNDQPLDEGLALTQAAVSGAPTQMAGVSEWITVAPGDRIALELLQESGGALDVIAPTLANLAFR